MLGVVPTLLPRATSLLHLTSVVETAGLNLQFVAARHVAHPHAITHLNDKIPTREDGPGL